MTRQHRVFVYNDMSDLFGLLTAEKVGEATYPEGHSTMVSLGHTPGLIPDRNGGPISGELWLLPPYTLAALDVQEGCPHLMRRAKIKVMVDGHLVRAWAYLLADPASWGNRPEIGGGNWDLHKNPVKASREAYLKRNKLGQYTANTAKEPVGDTEDYEAWWDNYAEREAAATPLNEDLPSTFDDIVAKSLHELQEGNTITIKTRNGQTMTWRREGGNLRLNPHDYNMRGHSRPKADPPAPEPPNEACGVPYGPPRLVEKPAESSFTAGANLHERWCMKTLNKGSCDCGLEASSDSEDDGEERMCTACGEPIYWATDTWGWLGPNSSPDCAFGVYHTPGVFDARRKKGTI